VADDEMVAKAIGHAVEAGLPAEEIDAVLVRASAEEDDAFRAPVTAGKLYARIRLRRPARPPAESPVARRDGDPNPW
jgi:hypothetical protein